MCVCVFVCVCVFPSRFLKSELKTEGPRGLPQVLEREPRSGESGTWPFLKLSVINVALQSMYELYNT